MMAALAYRLVSTVDRILGGEPLEPAPEPPVDDVPDEFEESRPVDLDDCSVCEGTGLVVVNDWMTRSGLVDVTCARCGGTGERGAA